MSVVRISVSQWAIAIAVAALSTCVCVFLTVLMALPVLHGTLMKSVELQIAHHSERPHDLAVHVDEYRKAVAAMERLMDRIEAGK